MNHKEVMMPPIHRLLMLALIAAGGMGQRTLLAAPAPSAGLLAIDDDPLPEGVIARLGSTRWRHSNMVRCLAFAPDGKTLASGGGDAVVRLWDAATGQARRVFAGHQFGMEGLAFSPDGATLATTESGLETPVILWNARNGQERRRLKRSGGMPFSGGGGAVAFSPDGATLAASNAGGEVVLWDAVTGRKKGVVCKHEHSIVVRIVFAPDGKVLASCGQDGAIRLGDVVRRKSLHVLRAAEAHVGAIVFTRDGKRLLSGGGTIAGGLVRVWDVSTGKQQRILTIPKPSGFVSGLDLAPDGRTLVVGGGGWAELWDLLGSKRLRSLQGIHLPYQGMWLLRFAPDGKRIAGAMSSAVCLWETASGRLLTPGPTEATGGITALALSADGRTLAAADAGGTCGVWDLPARRLRHRLRGHRWTIRYVAISPDGKGVVTASEDGSVRLWDALTGRERRRLCADPPNDSRPSAVAFSPDGKRIATTHYSTRQQGGPRFIRLWDADSGKELQRQDIDKIVHGWFIALAFQADGRQLRGTTVNGETYRWRIGGGILGKGKVVHHDPWASAGVAYSPHGLLATANSLEEGITLWDTYASCVRLTLAGPQDAWRHLAYSSDGRYIASVASLFGGSGRAKLPDHTLRVWEIASGQEVLRRQLPARTGAGSLAFTPDGRTLVSGMTDTTVLTWDVFPLSPLERGGWAARWDDLAHADAPHVHRVVAALMAGGDASVALLARRLEPARHPAAARVARLLADLDSDEFTVREVATRELTKMAETVRPALKRTRAKASLEARRRIMTVLRGETGPVHSGRLLRGIRAVAVLEQIGTPAARKLLRTLAGGVPDARLTHEAKTALERLTRRSSGR